jgi:hypothetical protein
MGSGFLAGELHAERIFARREGVLSKNSRRGSR